MKRLNPLEISYRAPRGPSFIETTRFKKKTFRLVVHTEINRTKTILRQEENVQNSQ